MFSFFKKLFGESNTNHLKEIIDDNAILVDVRSVSEFANGSAKGAINIPLDQIPKHLSKFKNKKHIIVFCRSGNRSNQAKNILEQNGFENVMNGGTWNNIANLVK